MEEMKCLELLMLHGTLKGLPSSIKRLVGLKDLSLSAAGVMILGQFPSSFCLSLVSLDLRGHDCESILTSIKQLSKLRTSDISYCNMLQSIPDLSLRIKYLEVNNCKQLRSLPQLPSNIEQCDDDEYEFPRNVDFSFANCVNLIGSISQQRVDVMAIALGLFYKKIRQFKFSLPGSEIPEWFNHQNFGSLITIERPQQYCGNRRFIGFALSAVVVVTYGLWVKYHNNFVKCCYSFGFYKEVCLCDSIPLLNGTDHIAISFCPAKGGYTTVTFNFSVIWGLMKLKCCGVCPIYEEPNMCSANFLL